MKKNRNEPCRLNTALKSLSKIPLDLGEKKRQTIDAPLQ